MNIELYNNWSVIF